MRPPPKWKTVGSNPARSKYKKAPREKPWYRFFTGGFFAFKINHKIVHGLVITHL